MGQPPNSTHPRVLTVSLATPAASNGKYGKGEMAKNRPPRINLGRSVFVWLPLAALPQEENLNLGPFSRLTAGMGRDSYIFAQVVCVWL